MKTLPAVGTRVMRIYGRKDYAEFGEIGTVTAHNPDGRTFQMTLDDMQPYARAMFGSKAKLVGHSDIIHDILSPTEVENLVNVYNQNAKRLRAVAKAWADAAKHEKEKS